MTPRSSKEFISHHHFFVMGCASTNHASSFVRGKLIYLSVIYVSTLSLTLSLSISRSHRCRRRRRRRRRRPPLLDDPGVDGVAHGGEVWSAAALHWSRRVVSVPWSACSVLWRAPRPPRPRRSPPASSPSNAASSSFEGLADIVRHVKGCRLTQETRVHNELDDVTSNT